MSKFYKVQCKCGKERTIFSHTTSAVACESCGTELAQVRGGEAVIHGKKKALD